VPENRALKTDERKDQEVGENCIMISFVTTISNKYN
jgi:hypothetical protein